MPVVFRGTTARADEVQCECHWGSAEELALLNEVGRSFSQGDWHRWPVRQSTAVEEFLHAWWAHSLTDPDPVVPVHELLGLCAEASGTISPWLTVWEALDHPVADRHLAEAADHWEHDLLGDELPWQTWGNDNADDMRTELTAWLVRHAPARLRTRNATAETEELLHRVRLMGLTGPARWEDPHWPNHHY
ncbi:hypothetical protein OG787_19305 [Streptomyces sp. NBC_00075]